MKKNFKILYPKMDKASKLRFYSFLAFEKLKKTDWAGIN